MAQPALTGMGGEGREHRTAVVPWTRAQTKALGEFIRREKAAAEAAGKKPPFPKELISRAMTELGPAVLGERGAISIRNKIDFILRRGGGEEEGEHRQPTRMLWTPAQAEALETLVRREIAACGKPIPASMLAARAMAELGPTVLGEDRGVNSVRGKIRQMLAQDGVRPPRDPSDYYSAAQTAALKALIRREQMGDGAATGATDAELTSRAMRLLVPGVLGTRSWTAVERKIKAIRRGYD